MRVDLFDFALPPERIALRPSEPREAARMLVVDPAKTPDFSDAHVADLPHCLRAGDVLVVNDTRVIPARLTGARHRGEATARIEATLHKREAADVWRAFVRPAKKLAVGETVRFGDARQSSAAAFVDGTVVEKGEDGEVLFAFALSGAALDEAIEAIGRIPLPPYIASKRAEDAQDRVDYQTVFATEPGAVAAPTAGLHFTPGLLSTCEARGVDVLRVTLHVGAGTFLPVKADDTENHVMHTETGYLTASAAERIAAARSAGGRIVAVGTTSLRLLESAASEDGTVRPFAGDTSIFITPGYRFRAVDLLLTNFHLPRSTLFMLVSAFAGTERMKRAYAHAIAAGYRFYSYGDACLLTRADL